jgi:hypothetical protein
MTITLVDIAQGGTRIFGKSIRTEVGLVAAYAMWDIGYGTGAPENLEGHGSFGLVARELDTHFALMLLVKC